MVAGAGGATLDEIHVRAGVLSYPHTVLFDQPWWVAPQFGLAALLMLAAARPFAAASARRVPHPSGSRVGTEALWFVGAYAASGVFGNNHPAALTVTYAVTWLARLAWHPDRLVVAVTGIALAGGGVVYEGTLAGTGLFRYVHPDVYHVPVWLAGIYLHGAPLLLTVARQLSGPAVPAAPHAGTRVGPRR